MALKVDFPTSASYNDTVRVSASFTDSTGTAQDPSTVTFSYQPQATGSTTTLTYGVDAALVKASSGHYYVDLLVTTGGLWNFNFIATGTGADSQQGYFYVQPNPLGGGGTTPTAGVFSALKEDLQRGFGSATRTDSTGAILTGHKIGVHTVVDNSFLNANDFGSLDAAISQLASTPGIVLLPVSYAGAEFSSLPNVIALIDLRQKVDGLTDATTNIRRPSQILINSRAGEVTGRTLTGPVTMTSGSTAVTGSGTLFLTEVTAGDTIKLSADGNTAWGRVQSVTNNLALTLNANYTGTGGTGAALNGQAVLPLVIHNYATGTPNTSQSAETVGLTVISQRVSGNRQVDGANFNTSIQNKLNGAAAMEASIENYASADFAEAGEVNNNEVTECFVMRCVSAGTKRVQGGLKFDVATGAEMQRCISMDKAYAAKGIYFRGLTGNAGEYALYFVAGANNANGCVIFQNATDAATVAVLNNDGTSQWTGCYPLSAGAGNLGTSGLPWGAGNITALTCSGTFQAFKGTAVASANNMTLNSGNVFHVTGNTTINAITSTGVQAGCEVMLIFDSNPTVKNNTAGGAGTSKMLLSGSVDMSATANDTLTLVYDGTSWFEKCRTVI